MRACGFSLIFLSPCCATAHFRHPHDGMVFLYSFMDFTSRFSLFPSAILYMLRKYGGVFFCGLFFGWWKWHLGGRNAGGVAGWIGFENRRAGAETEDVAGRIMASGGMYGRTIGWKRRPRDDACGDVDRRQGRNTEIVAGRS